MTVHTDIREGDPRPLREVKTEVPPEIIYVPRYNGITRVNHWITAILFTLLTISGLAMFTPYLESKLRFIKFFINNFVSAIEVRLLKL